MASSCCKTMVAIMGGISLCLSLAVGAAELSPATAPATDGPATQPSMSLQAEITRTVELAQRSIRSPKPASRPVKNSLQREEREALSSDPLAPLADELVGKSGLISFRVIDVMPNDGLHFPFGEPSAVMKLRGSLPYMVIAEVVNPTALQLTPKERREILQANQKGQKNLADFFQKEAEKRRPSHRLVVGTDDPAVRNWGKGERRLIRGTIVAVRLERMAEPYVPVNVEYVRVNMVVRYDRVPATAGSPER